MPNKISKISHKDDHIDENKEFYSKMVNINEEGVTFKSIIDGSLHYFTPEKSIEIQHNIGADIIFAFDECTDRKSTRLNSSHRL